MVSRGTDATRGAEVAAEVAAEEQAIPMAVQILARRIGNEPVEVANPDNEPVEVANPDNEPVVEVRNNEIAIPRRNAYTRSLLLVVGLNALLLGGLLLTLHMNDTQIDIVFNSPTEF